MVRTNNGYSGPRVLSTGAPQVVSYSRLLFTLFTDCASLDRSVLVTKFSSDTTVIGLISDGDEGGVSEGG